MLNALAGMAVIKRPTEPCMQLPAVPTALSVRSLGSDSLEKRRRERQGGNHSPLTNATFFFLAREISQKAAKFSLFLSEMNHFQFVYSSRYCLP